MLLAACGSFGLPAQSQSAQPDTSPQENVQLPLADEVSEVEQESKIDESVQVDENVSEPETEVDFEAESSDPYPDSSVDEVTAAEVEDAYPSSDATAENVEGEEPAPKPTPRGDALEATDPTTVSLASGQYQLIELFAFW